MSDRRAEFDAMEDGNGPIHCVGVWPEFVTWAKDHLGQGYSLACSDGSIVDPVTRWAFAGYVAGRRAK